MKKRNALLVASLIFLFLVSCISKKPKFLISDFSASQAKRSEREQFKKNLLDKTILQNLATELTPETESAWQSAFWGMELSLYRSREAMQSMRKAAQTFFQRSETFQRAFLEAVYCLYPSEFSDEISQIAKTVSTPKLFAMAIHYLCRLHENQKPAYLKLLEEKFPDWQNQPILYMLAHDLQTLPSDRFSQRPSLVEILKHPFQSGKAIIYSFQRHDRDYPGLAIMKNPDGRFVRDQNGGLFHISQLARSISNLPGYITNGNTPQGIFSIQGIETVKNAFIGPSPTLQLVLPFEASLKIFFHHHAFQDTVWSKTQYETLLPESWKNYNSVYEAYFAGLAGRTEIIAHGTTIDPNFYSGKQYFPNTPSLGCLCAKEFWSPGDGHCLISDQLLLINAFLSIGEKEGFFVVIEIDDKKQPLVLDELILDILQAEGSF